MSDKGVELKAFADILNLNNEETKLTDKFDNNPELQQKKNRWWKDIDGNSRYKHMFMDILYAGIIMGRLPIAKNQRANVKIVI